MKTSRRPFLAFLLAAVLAAAGGACGERRPAAGPIQTERLLVGAYYYTWFPNNFGQGFLRGELLPPQRPEGGVYRSWEIPTIERHIARASRYGVDFFALDWWPGRPRQNALIEKAFLKAGNIGDVGFCICYETWDLGFDKMNGTLVFDRAKSDRLVADMIRIAERYFAHPSYLKVGGRPVVILYLTRTFRGEFAAALARVRSELAARGFDPFIVGDEIFWKVSPVLSRQPFPLATKPQPQRLRSLDAITGYNFYENEKPAQRGYPARSAFVGEVTQLLERYRDAAGEALYFVPSVIPGYNDRGVRLFMDHYAIPRQWDEGAPEGSTFAGLLDRIALPFVDPRLNLLLVTSWNEWNEDTAIEPLDPAEPTRADRSRSGRDFTQGYPYAGYGTTYLEVLRDKTVAVAGRLTDSTGAPRRGVAVAASQDGRELARGRSDRDGYYRLSRLRLPPGVYAVAAPGAASQGPRRVEVRAETTAADVDFTVSADAGTGN